MPQPKIYSRTGHSQSLPLKSGQANSAAPILNGSTLAHKPWKKSVTTVAPEDKQSTNPGSVAKGQLKSQVGLGQQKQVPAAKGVAASVALTPISKAPAKECASMPVVPPKARPAYSYQGQRAVGKPYSPYPRPRYSARVQRKRFIKNLLSNVLFVAVLLGVVLGLGLYKQVYKPGSSILGYSFYTVLSGSMEREIPKGSLVVVKSVPSNELHVGDDITFYRDKDTIVTHRIIEVVENLEETGGLGFITQGVENPMPDAKAVHELNVVGKVVTHLAGFGLALSMIGANLKWVILLLCLLLVIITALRIFFWDRKATGKKRGKRVYNNITP